MAGRFIHPAKEVWWRLGRNHQSSIHQPVTVLVGGRGRDHAGYNTDTQTIHHRVRQVFSRYMTGVMEMAILLMLGFGDISFPRAVTPHCGRDVSLTLRNSHRDMQMKIY
ncbi:hypothetical protein Bbelb_208690 [Branchiostoma belcheri]|nr:hypothetical protein Bbelb_208690 [Branchiostoma belcheri]